jgi:hypothetical protein
LTVPRVTAAIQRHIARKHSSRKRIRESGQNSNFAFRGELRFARTR